MNKERIETIIARLTLSPGQLGEIAQTLAERIRTGLEAEGREIAALPTFLPPPPPDLAGEALAADLGGTNLRAARVRLEGTEKAEFPAGPVARALGRAWKSAGEFFSAQAALAAEVASGASLPLGYCFSYPTRPLPDRDAVMLGWNKGVEVPGVLGRPVGAPLREALRAERVRTSRVTVLNDTVAALLGGISAFSPAGAYSDFIGLIVGTGTNIAAFFPAKMLAPRLGGAAYPHERMAVNLESGNFHPPHLSRDDDELDARRPDALRQRMEKAVSGKFLPELYAFLAESPAPGPRELFRLARENSPAGRLAAAVVGRSADLVAAALAGTILVLRPAGRVGILAEGGVIANEAFYRQRTAETLRGILRASGSASLEADFALRENVNLIGAAVAALLP